jgi:hypothetical protein
MLEIVLRDTKSRLWPVVELLLKLLDEWRERPVLHQGFSTFSKPISNTFTRAYGLADRKITNKYNLVNIYSSLLLMLLTYYYKQVYIIHSNFLQQNQSLVRYLTPLLLE